MASIFTKIINGEIPCYKIAEDEKHFAFLDINPVAPGHTLVVPKHEISYIFDLSDEEYVELELFAKKVALGLQEAVPCTRIAEAVIGLEVPHTHIHLVPIKSEGDMNFSHKLQLPAEEMEALAAKISAAVAPHLK
ncbi:MAG: HIT family protein [Paramuribaculum sp.]|nr:HIT family protein [Paramuribaculum sp.]